MNKSSKRIYKVWRGMLERCYYEKNNHYKNYGRKGIKVCDEWRIFENFESWAINNGYNPYAKRGECTLDRIEIDGDYNPKNCRWVSNKIQCNNKRNNIKIEYKNEIHTLKEWSEIYNIKYFTLLQRFKNNWNYDKMFGLKPKKGRNQYK